MGTQVTLMAEGLDDEVQMEYPRSETKPKTSSLITNSL